MPVSLSPSEFRSDSKLIWKGAITSCDTCSALQEDIGHQLQYCSSCQVAKYCSTDCQKVGWKDGKHKKKCQELRLARNVSTTYSAGEEPTADATVNYDKRANKWISHNCPTLFMISAMACNYNPALMRKVHIHLYVKAIVDKLPGHTNTPASFFHVMPNGRPSDSQEFYIAEVHLVPKAAVEPPPAWGPGFLCNMYIHAAGTCKTVGLSDAAVMDLPPPRMLSMWELIKYFNRGIGWCFSGPEETHPTQPSLTMRSLTSVL